MIGMNAQALAQIKAGHLEMAVCCTFYLIWWIIFFWPKIYNRVATGAPRVFGIISIIGAVVFGLLGAVGIASGAGKLNTPVAGIVTLVSGIALYILLLFITYRLFQRNPTTELVLFVAWIALELFCAYGLQAAGLAGQAVLLIILALAGFVISLMCYVLYYHLDPKPSFIDGCLPLTAIGVISLVMGLVL
jgi:hypothetical protein